MAAPHAQTAREKEKEILHRRRHWHARCLRGQINTEQPMSKNYAQSPVYMQVTRLPLALSVAAMQYYTIT